MSNISYWQFNMQSKEENGAAQFYSGMIMEVDIEHQN